MFSETYLTSKTVINSAFRSIVINIDHAVYGLLELVYQLFFNVASSENVFSNATVIKFYGRVQLILGVFMMFQLALIILRGIVNPDSFTDKKSGAGNLITRVVTALVLLTVLVPINVPKDRASMNEYEKKISGNGLLFGTLYSLQHRLLAGNTIGKLVLGSSAADTYDISSNGDELMNAAKLFSATVARGFYRINLIPYDQREHSPDGFDELITGNRVCQDMGDAFDVYRDTDSSAGDIIGIANETCSDNAVVGAITGKKISSWLGNEKYMFTIMPFISTAAAIVFIFIFISFSVDVAVRAIKLAVLRLIAPIPIISYMDPKGSKDSSFNSWVKSLTSTYLDLFVRLAIIYFVLFLIQDMIKNGSAITRSSANGSGILGILSMFIIWIGLFVFAKQAPKFIRQVLGLKDDGGGKGIFSGLGSVFAVGAAAGGIFGSAAANYRAAKEENAALRDKNGNPLKAQGLRNFGSAIAGAIGGGAVGAKALMGKDATAKSVLQAQNQRNATRLAHSTATGRFADSMYGMFTGKSLADKLSDTGTAGKDAFSALKSWKESVKAEAAKNGGAFNYQLSNGAWLNGITFDQVRAAKQAGADANGMYTINGAKYSADLLGDVVMDKIADEQVKAWQSGSVINGGKSYISVTTGTGKLAADHERTIKAVSDAEIVVNGHSGSALVDSYDDLGNAMGEANRMHQRSETNMQQRMRIANKQNKK